ncbi:MAG: hypothetical protein ISS15_07770 [Alphaproteobacteria bacterium]|nr:hypothetical protein [Alphaproteobacteria bacterium]MBL6936769.1 hypothetical protein [Alphaproteobacteria bacterium]MBL7097538.1 hypothetical protein [Alphaproteobacteria bacterium]
MTLLTIIGVLGSAAVIIAYFSSQQGWLHSDDWRFPALNLAGAALILASLYEAWNLPSAVMEGFWVLISVYGLLRARGSGALG